MGAITRKKPIVPIPVDEYIQLLTESGIKPTPKLIREIAQARSEFCKGKTQKWETLKHDLKLSR